MGLLVMMMVMSSLGILRMILALPSASFLSGICIAIVLETIVGAGVPNHVASDLLPVRLSSADSVHVSLCGVATKACHDSSSWN
jgi:hypothetical protein